MNAVTIILPDGIGTAGVAYDGENYYACDGFNSKIYIFDQNGVPSGCACTLRPYRSLRYDTLSGGFIALGGGCRSGIYFLSDDFRELGVVVPAVGGCTRINYVGVSIDGAHLDITYDRAIYRCDRSGGYVDTLNLSSGDTQFIAYDEYTEGSALAYENESGVFVSVGGSSSVLPSCSTLKSFMPFADRMYAAVGYRYIYTYIFKIADGDDSYTSGLQSGIFGYNRGKGCCKI